MSLQDNQISDFSSFQLNGLKNVEQTVFSQKNLIIGKNGSGKTRFLKALEQEKKLTPIKKGTVITLYFSEIQAFYKTIQNRSQEADIDEDGLTQEIYPYDLLLGNEDSSFYDFLKVMENDKGTFLSNILSVFSMKKTKQSSEAQKLLERLNNLLTEFLDKKVKIDSATGQIYIETIND